MDKAALESKGRGHKRQMFGFTDEDIAPHISSKDRSGHGAPIILDNEEIGRVTKFTYGYISKKASDTL